MYKHTDTAYKHTDTAYKHTDTGAIVMYTKRMPLLLLKKRRRLSNLGLHSLKCQFEYIILFTQLV